MSTSPVPAIEISLAPPDEPQPEPYSPFTPMNSGFSSPSDDSYRPALLTPPAQSWSLSPHRPLASQAKGRGIKDDDFQALLRASKERSAAVGAKKQDLRKEVALKVYKSKQVERRALFLSKIGAPPSPTAVSLPKTPPESPAIFHYSLPSPGLVSPLALFEKLGLDDQASEQYGVRKAWVEQVDFRLPERPVPKLASLQVTNPTIIVTPTPPEGPFRKGHARKTSVPSLEQITQRYTSQTVSAPLASPMPARARAPLPAFLITRRQSPPPPCEGTLKDAADQPSETARPRLASTGRIHFPTCSPSPPSKHLPPIPLEPLVSAPSRAMPRCPRQRTHALPSTPVSPLTPVSPRPAPLLVTTTHVPRTSSTSPVKLTAENLLAFNSRARTARDMLCAIRRRTAVFERPCALSGLNKERLPGLNNEKCQRRISAPAELPRIERFAHPVLALPGGF